MLSFVILCNPKPRKFALSVPLATFLVIAWRLTGQMVVGSQKFVGDPLRANPLGPGQASPQVLRGWERVEVSILAGQEVVLNDPVSVRRIGELQAEDLRVFLGLLQPIAWLLVRRFRLHHREHEVAGMAQEVVSTLLRPPSDLRTGNNDAAIGEGELFVDMVVSPASVVEFGEDELSTSIRFGAHN
jgi:hypothetical protein